MSNCCYLCPTSNCKGFYYKKPELTLAEGTYFATSSFEFEARDLDGQIILSLNPEEASKLAFAYRRFAIKLAPPLEGTRNLKWKNFGKVSEVLSSDSARIVLKLLPRGEDFEVKVCKFEGERARNFAVAENELRKFGYWLYWHFERRRK